jgi:hypothetical protein
VFFPRFYINEAFVTCPSLAYPVQRLPLPRVPCRSPFLLRELDTDVCSLSSPWRSGEHDPAPLESRQVKERVQSFVSATLDQAWHYVLAGHILFQLFLRKSDTRLDDSERM